VRLPPLSAVVSAAAFRPSSGHGLPAPGTSGSILRSVDQQRGARTHGCQRSTADRPPPLVPEHLPGPVARGSPLTAGTAPHSTDTF
jgi:hypothetical protein